LKSPFIFKDENSGKEVHSENEDLSETITETYHYDEGQFQRIKNDEKYSWIEKKNTDNANHIFNEYFTDKNFYYLKSADREINITIPVKAGFSYISFDNGKTWQKWWVMNK
jgi:hypothetical protein